MGLHTSLPKWSVILRRNLFPQSLINKYISKYIQTVAKGRENTVLSRSRAPGKKFNFKISYVGHFSVTTQRSIRKLANQLG